MCLKITSGFLEKITSGLLKNAINERQIGVKKKRHKNANRIK